MNQIAKETLENGILKVSIGGGVVSSGWSFLDQHAAGLGVLVSFLGVLSVIIFKVYDNIKEAKFNEFKMRVEVLERELKEANKRIK